MKIVIDLPDEVVKWFKGKGFIPIGQYLTVDEAMKKAEPLSEILDKISAEIERLDTESWELSITDVLNVIDRYREGDKE